MARTKVVRPIRRLLALALVAGLMLINVQAADLHVHDTTDHLDDAHHHGPASHHHDVVDHHSDTTQVTGVDADDTVVAVAFVGASAQSVKPLDTGHDGTPLFQPGVPSMVDAVRIVPRAHGPPSIAQPSLRAPPVVLSL
jgi:hypothetical protein